MKQKMLKSSSDACKLEENAKSMVAKALMAEYNGDSDPEIFQKISAPDAKVEGLLFSLNDSDTVQDLSNENVEED